MRLHTTTWAMIAAGALALSGCGSSGGGSSSSSSSSSAGGNPTTVSSPGAWTGMGAALADWTSAHPKYAGKCEETPCYGSSVTEGGIPTAQFSGVTTTGSPAYRVDGYRQSLGDGTPVAIAKAEVLKLLPPDTRTMSYEVVHSADGSCALWNVKSATIGRWLAEAGPKVGDSQGALGIELSAYSSSDEPVYQASNIGHAIISISASPKGTGC